MESDRGGRAPMAWSLAALTGVSLLVFPPAGIAIGVPAALYARRWGLREPFLVTIVAAILCALWSAYLLVRL